MRLVHSALIGLPLLLAPAAHAAEKGSLNPHLEPFRPLLGKTWIGELKEPDSAVVRTNVARWERALNGEAIRTLHSVNNGEYGGETVIVWDAGQNKLIYFYFTTAGFRTTGTFTFDGAKFLAEEQVTGNTQGITKVRSVGEIQDDGTLVNKSEYFKDGEWVPGHEQTYREDATAEVKFK